MKTGSDLFAPDRRNAIGFDLSDVTVLASIKAVRCAPAPLAVGPIVADGASGGASESLVNPATGEVIGDVTLASMRDVETALAAATPWSAETSSRAGTLRRAADLFEAGYGEAFALLAVEAGKTLGDAVAELREAVDFLRYYAMEAERLTAPCRGVFTCISPWNFPLAIFTGQVAAALATGNAVLAKPAEATPTIAAWAVEKLHQAGVPRDALQLLPGDGGTVGARLTSDPRVAGVSFTGSTATARRIQAAMATACAPGTPLIAGDGRAERDDRRQHRSAGTSRSRYCRLGVPIGWPALFRSALPLCAGGDF